jgi:hypothetical protein
VATKKPTPADIRKLVTRVARKIARNYGTTLSPAGLKRLLAPSKTFFAKEKIVKISESQLTKELTPLVLDAVRASTPPPKQVKVRGIRGPVYENPRPKPKPVTAKAIGTAMKRATCHFLWFC